MAFMGWLQLAGTEIVNNQRAIQYARHMAPEIIPECEDCPDLALALGDAEYRSPALDEAPWWDPNVGPSSKFAGLYALDISGLEDDSREAPVFQAAFDGGAIGRVRRRTKDIRVTGLLIAEDDEGLSFGMEWLKNALDGSECPDPTTGCSGDDLCFFSACPDIVEGAIDPDAEPVTHEVSLGPWEVTGGTWLNGRWQLFGTPRRAVGPSLGELPCDEVVLAYDLEATEGTRVRLFAVDEDTGAPLLPGREVVLRRTNWARNPSFSTGTTTFWSTGANASLDGGPSTPPDRGILTVTSDVGAGETLATAEGASGQPGDVFSGRMRVQMDPTGVVWTNVVPNPAVRTLGGFTGPGVTRDTSVFFTDSGSARVTVADDGTESVGPVTYGAEDDRYAIRVDDSETYGLSAYVRSSVSARARLVATWLAADGDPITTVAYATTALSANTWLRLEESSGAPDGAVRLSLGVEFFAPDGSTLNSGDRLYVDALMVSPQQPLAAYFDGDSEDAYWDGLPHSSPSTLSPSGDSACVQLRVDGPSSSTLGPSVVVTPDEPSELEVSGATLTASGQVTVSLVSCGDIPAGSALYLSNTLLEQAEEPGEYFDGNTESTDTYDYRWLGSSGLAASQQAIAGPVEVTVPLSSAGVRPAIEALDGSLVQVDGVTASYRPAADPFECADQYERTIREVTATSGPTILERFDTCNGRMWRVEFFLTAAVPWVWQRLRPEFQVLPGSSVQWTPVEADCEEEPEQPINDPDCPLPPPPPRPPAIPRCDLQPLNYRRRSVLIPGDVIAPSQRAVPIITIEVDEAARDTRIRFYANPLSREDLDDLDPCGYCGEFVVSYIPAGSSIVLDGMTETAVVRQAPDIQRPASHLLRATDGGPMQWPLLTCGIPYTMTVDVAPTNVEAVTTNVELAARS